MKFTRNKGFTCIEAIYSLWVVYLSILLLTLSISLLKNNVYKNYVNEDRAFLYQMQILYALGEEKAIKNEMLEFLYKNNKMYFRIYGDKLILLDGYQVFLNDIKGAYFKEDEGCTYIYYERDKWKKEIVGCR